MSEYNTVKGQAYAVTARGASSVTDENGLNLSVEAGGQTVFVASTDKAEVSGDHVLVQCREGSSISGAGGGGGEVDPSNFVSKVEFDTFKEGNEQALEGKQVKLTAGTNITLGDDGTISAAGGAVYTAGDGISISNNEVAMSGSLDKSLAIGGTREESTVIYDGYCAVFRVPLPIHDANCCLTDGDTDEYAKIGNHADINTHDDLLALAARLNAETTAPDAWSLPFGSVAHATAFSSGGDSYLCIASLGRTNLYLEAESAGNPLWSYDDPAWQNYRISFSYQSVSADQLVPTDYTLSLNGTAIKPATAVVEAGNNAPVSSAAVYAKWNELNTALIGKQDVLTLQTTLSNNTSQVTTGAAVYKALGNRTSLTFDSTLSTTSTNPIQNKAVATALSTYATKDELEDATSIEQETLHDSAWADDIDVLASGDYLSATANKDLTKTPMTVSMDLHFWIPDGSTSDIDASEDIHAIKVPLSGSGTGMRLFLPLSAIPSSKRSISTGGSVSLVGMSYLSSGPLTEEDYAQGYTYLYPRGFSLSVNDLISRASLNFGAGSDESEVYFGKSPGPTIPFKTLKSLKVYQSLADGSCLCVSFASSSWNNVGTPIGVVYMEGTPIKDVVSSNTADIAAVQAKNVEQDGRLDNKQDALTAGEGISIVDNTISATGVVSKEPVELELTTSTLLLELDFSLNRVPSYGAMLGTLDGEVSEETDYVWNKVLTKDNVDEWIAFLNSNTASSTLVEYSKVVDGSRCLLKCKSLREGLLIWIMPDGAHLSDPQYPWHEEATTTTGISVGGDVLKDKVKYHFEVPGPYAIGLQSITPEEYGTCELWLDIPANSTPSLAWPSVWEWKDPDEAPAQLDPGYRYCIVLRHDGLGVLVSINYQRKLP